MLAIALIVACGSGVLIMSLTAHRALSETADAYYGRYRFVDVFANVRRAPLATAERIAAIDTNTYNRPLEDVVYSISLVK